MFAFAKFLKTPFLIEHLWWLLLLFIKTFIYFIKHIPAGNCIFKTNIRNIRARCEICWKLTIRTSKQCQWCRSGVLIVNFEHISLCSGVSIVNFEQVSIFLLIHSIHSFNVLMEVVLTNSFINWSLRTFMWKKQTLEMFKKLSTYFLCNNIWSENFASIIKLVFQERYEFYYVCLKSKTLRNCLSSSFVHSFSEITRGFGAKNSLQTIGQLIQFSYLLLSKDVFLVYSFSEQVAAKGDSPKLLD